MIFLYRFLFCLVAIFANLPIQAELNQEIAQPRFNSKPSVSTKSFMVTAAHPEAVKAGYEILRQGGSAVDAAIAIQMVLNLVEPQSSGIGGGAFLLHWNAADQSLISIDGRETAPQSAGPGHFLDANGKPVKFWDAVVGGQSTGTPGTLRLLELAHNKFGRLPWSKLFDPAIQLARNGFIVTPRLSESVERAKNKGLNRFKDTRNYFFPNGIPLIAGSTLKNPAFADTLATIAGQGVDAFYHGPIAEDIVASAKSTSQHSDTISLVDLANYRAVIRDPVCANYREYKVCGMGPPSSGGITVGQILGLLNDFKLEPIGDTSNNAGYDPVNTIHLYAEAAKLAYADRNFYIADSDFIHVPVAGLLDPSYLSDRAKLIQATSIAPLATHGRPPGKIQQLLAPDQSLEQPGTSHFSIVDRYGNVLSMTSTIEMAFGNRVMVRGLLLNNELTDFSRVPKQNDNWVANRVEGGKRPRSSMAPTIVFDNKDNPILVIGSPGGSRIINYVAKSIIAILDWKMDVQKAIDLGHFVNRNGPIELEANTKTAQYEEKLRLRGHKVKTNKLTSGLHAILIKPNQLIGGADSRREGVVMGE
ncbi:gamma-glutamyltransferase [Pseudomonadota bacterium]